MCVHYGLYVYRFVYLLCAFFIIIIFFFFGKLFTNIHCVDIFRPHNVVVLLVYFFINSLINLVWCARGASTGICLLACKYLCDAVLFLCFFFE